ncbi:MAG: type II secretion system F family protein [Sporomusaceae bacterium]|nr:type II secretion system F family protein [Sporomusaceae bacterium]
MLIVALFSGMLTFLLLLALIEYCSRAKTPIAHKVRRYAGTTDAVAEKPEYLSAFMKFIRYLGLRVRGLPSARKLEVKMQQAGLPLLGSEFLAMLAVAAVAAGLLALMLTLRADAAVGCGLLAAFACLLYLERRIVQRRQDFGNQLGDALAMLANSMRSGFSLIQAMDLLTREMKPPLAAEFLKTLAEIRLGADIETALLNMGRRLQSSDLDLVITAVLIQRQVGGNLAQILDSIAATINERLKMKREIKTLTAQGRLSGWVLAALPAVIGLFAAVVNPAYMRPFIDEPLGRLVLAVTLVWQLIGWLVIRRIVNIDV